MDSVTEKNFTVRLTVILIIVFLGLLSSTSIFAGTDLIMEKTISVSSGETLYLETDVGDVYIKTWSGSEVNVKIYGNSKAEDNMEFSIERVSGGVRVRGDKEGGFWKSWFNSINVKYEIMVPEEFNTDIKTSGGDIKIGDLRGKVLAKTSGGDIYLGGAQGIIELGTSGGDITVNNSSGDIEAKTSGGDIEITGSEGSMEAKTSGGDIRLKYDGVNKGVKLYTSGGDIDVFVGTDFSADVYLSTSGGDVECNVPNTRANTIKSHKFEGEINGGGQALNCKTSGGDITVRSI
ncbi:MAG: DUF4097 domain-containing protein [Melioribacteraceae bacterium]|nr:DUF4097 domain-containing protein [Melioribacteraceae bacterium]MCF8355631.1 DUF4097 domain-containing protein [Melioribacteraceae bacterium]MCF8394669.1 DUF4097 domain-containing protein [Melioribacteraceae bacterium]MCF8417997.1 DUF4097 domain-containing protein [Melioribacteraceae bacterium]